MTMGVWGFVGIAGSTSLDPAYDGAYGKAIEGGKENNICIGAQFEQYQINLIPKLNVILYYIRADFRQ